MDAFFYFDGITLAQICNHDCWLTIDYCSFNQSICWDLLLLIEQLIDRLYLNIWQKLGIPFNCVSIEKRFSTKWKGFGTRLNQSQEFIYGIWGGRGTAFIIAFGWGAFEIWSFFSLFSNGIPGSYQIFKHKQLVD